MQKVFLVVQSGALQGQLCSLGAASLLLGRADDCGLILGAYQKVSRHHARLDFDGQNLLVSDQNSTNGVLVNGIKVTRAALKNGDRLDLGDFSAVVRIENNAPKNAAPKNSAGSLAQKWRAWPAPQKWGVTGCALIVLGLGMLGMRRPRESDPFAAAPAAQAPVAPAADSPGSHSPSSNPAASGDAASGDAAPIPTAAPAPPAQTTVIAPVEPSGGRISAEAIRGAKAATVLIAHRTGQGYAMGSGFALGDPRRIVTNRHVVVDEQGRARDCLLIFEAGTPRERKVSVAAQNIALAPDASGREKFQDDLAVITLDSPQTPALSPGRSEALTETDEVYAVGFPLGIQTLTLNGDLPSASVKPARVERLQADANGAVTVIQLGSSVTHGNSGGPVINNRGEVVGVISSGVEGTGMAYAIPMGFVRALP